MRPPAVARGDRDSGTEPVRVLLVDDHMMVRQAMSAALERREPIRIVGVAESLAAAGTALADVRLGVDVVVADLQLGDGLGTEVVELAGRRRPSPAVLLVTGTEEQRGVEQALSSGCAGFVSKAQGLDKLVDAVLAVHAGAAVYPAGALAQVLGGESVEVGHDLTPREREILQLLAEAHTTDQIAGELVLSLHTVRNHIKQVLSKLHARSQLEAVVIAARNHLVTIA